MASLPPAQQSEKIYLLRPGSFYQRMIGSYIQPPPATAHRPGRQK